MGIMRGFVVIIYVVAFCIALWQVSTVWQLIEYAGAYAESTVFFSLLVAFCGVLISIFVYLDGEEIDMLKRFTGLTKLEGEELKLEMLEEQETTLEDYIEPKAEIESQEERSKAKKLVLCEKCAFFRNPVLCPYKERNPKAIACKYYHKKKS